MSNTDLPLSLLHAYLEQFKQSFKVGVEQTHILTADGLMLINHLLNTSPVHMLLWCPACGERHIDEGEFATKPHHTHACQECGVVWRPALVSTVGVRFLPGYKNNV